MERLPKGGRSFFRGTGRAGRVLPVHLFVGPNGAVAEHRRMGVEKALGEANISSL